MDLAQPERECVLSNAAVFAQLERVPRVISAGSRVWHRRAKLQYKPAEESLDASLSVSFPFQKQSKKHKAYRRVLKKHCYSYGKTFLCFPTPTLGHTDLALVLFWHHNDTHKKWFLSYHKLLLSYLGLFHWAPIN